MSGGTVMGGQEVMLVVLRFKHLLCQDSVLVSPGSAKPLKSISLHVLKKWPHGGSSQSVSLTQYVVFSVRLSVRPSVPRDIELCSWVINILHQAVY